MSLAAYEVWPRRRIRVLRRTWPLLGLSADEAAVTPPAPEVPVADARRAADMGKGLFMGAAYGIAIGMIVSELALRKKDAAKQLKQNHQLIGMSALFGGAVGALLTVQGDKFQS